MSQQINVPAGWYSDPTNRGIQRYWDGQAWTEHTHPGSTLPTASFGPVRATTEPRWWQSWWAIVAGLILFAPVGLIALWKRPGLGATTKSVVTGATALIVALALAMPSDTTTASTATHKPTAVLTTPAASPTTSTAPEPKTAAVPHLVGLSRGDAAAALRRAGLRLGAVQREPSSQPAGTVLRQQSSPGTSLGSGSKIAIILAAPLPQVPSVVGTGRSAAIGALQDAGFQVHVSTKATTSGVDDVVIGESPSAGSRVKPGSVVSLVVSDVHKPPTLSSAGTSNCTPGYSPCLPPASDYDCAGGSGDGPKYTGLVHVTGSDPYDLDRDGDGIGCD